MRSRPAGAAAVLGRPTTPGTIGLQRLAAPLTGPWPGGARPSLRTLAGRPEQLLRRAADRPAGADHPTGQLRTRAEQVGRRYRWDGLRQQRTHLRDVAVAHPAQQLGGRQGARIETGLRVAGVRTERLDLRRSPPGPPPATPDSPAPTTPTRSPPRSCCGRTAGPRTAAAHPPGTRPARPPDPSTPPGSARPARTPATSAAPTPPRP